MRTTEFLCEVLTGSVVVVALLALLLTAPVAAAQTTPAPGSCHVLIAGNISYLPCSAVRIERDA